MRNHPTQGSAILVADDGPEVGLGHRRRMEWLERELRAQLLIEARLLTRSGLLSSSAPAPDQTTDSTEQFGGMIQREINKQQASRIIFDLKWELWTHVLPGLLRGLDHVSTLGVDTPPSWCPLFEDVFFPSVTLSEQHRLMGYGNWGPDWLLMNRRAQPWTWCRGDEPQVLVLTGSLGYSNFSGWLGEVITKSVSPSVKIHWLGAHGHADEGEGITEPPVSIISDENVRQRQSSATYAVSRFGVSIFEMLGLGVPTVVLPGWRAHEEASVDFLEERGLALVARSRCDVGKKIAQLTFDDDLASSLSATTIEFFGTENKHPAVNLIENLGGGLHDEHI